MPKRLKIYVKSTNEKNKLPQIFDSLLKPLPNQSACIIGKQSMQMKRVMKEDFGTQYEGEL